MTQSKKERSLKPWLIGVFVVMAWAVVGWKSWDVYGTQGEAQAMATKNQAGNSQNRLGMEKSPYLLQHANNPVDWYPWGDEAFAEAKKQDKPIFLSIGYSTCHWCHVMEHESFENEETARLMNETFISIKVDREERPDIDNIYMNAVTSITGRGGWPLSAFLTPDGKPFFGGTYYPREKFERLIEQIGKLWDEDRDQLVGDSKKITALIQKNLSQNQAGTVTQAVLDQAYRDFESSFDSTWGGFGQSPKFPSPHNLSFLLRHYHRTADPQALNIVVKTLDGMAQGGIQDHLGGGFHRYSTDAMWLVPHFEKMLYDQAMLARAYLEAYLITGDDRHAEVARNIFDYVLRDMRDPGGGFYSAEDADSEGFEGKFFLWTPEDIEEILGTKKAKTFNRYYQIIPGGNFRVGAGHFEAGKSILRPPDLLDVVAKELGRSVQDLEKELALSREKVFEAREKRVRPHLDDKVLTSWNGLMISALALGARTLNEPVYARAAEEAASFILDKMERKGRLLRRYRDGEADILGYLDDYIFLSWGLMELYEATFNVRWLAEARRLSKTAGELFWDSENGGFFFSGKDGEKLLAATKEIYDGAIPSGNSLSAMVLWKLAHYTMDQDSQQRAEKMFEVFGGDLARNPRAYTQFLSAFDYSQGPRQEIVIAGDPDHKATKALLAEVRSRYLPQTVVLLHRPGNRGKDIEEMVSFLKTQGMVGGKPAAYVCENFTCQLPATDPGALAALLDKKS